jgi:aquaporin Z
MFGMYCKREGAMGGFFDDLRKAATLQAVLAELVGTGLLTLAALLAGTPYAVALILAALVYGLGPISGAQLNPAVTLGLLVARRQPVVKGVLYLVAQVVGALLAAKVAPSIGDLGSYSAGRPVGEFVGAGLLVLTVVAVSDKWVPKAGGGVAIGAALGAGLLLTNGVLNPAVALAMGLGRSPALWAAALGGVAFAALFDLLSVKQEEKQEEEGHEEEAAQQPAQDPGPRPIIPAYRPGTPVISAAPTPRVTVPRARPGTSPSTKTQHPAPTRNLWSSVTGLFGRKAKQQARREPSTRPASGD